MVIFQERSLSEMYSFVKLIIFIIYDILLIYEVYNLHIFIKILIY